MFPSYSARHSHLWFSMAIAFKSLTTSFFQLKMNNPETNSFLRFLLKDLPTQLEVSLQWLLSTLSLLLGSLRLSQDWQKRKKKRKKRRSKQASFILLSNPHLLTFCFVYYVMCSMFQLGRLIFCFIFPGLCFGCFDVGVHKKDMHSLISIATNLL